MNDTGSKAVFLRHGLRYLGPSEIGDQFYCEYKVHLRRLHPEVRFDLAPLESGSLSHAALASEAQPIIPAEIERFIQAGKRLAVCEWELQGAFRGVSIRGRPDLFACEGKKALLLLDFKFSSACAPFRGQEVQAQVYALLAESMAFVADELLLGIVLFPAVAFTSSLRESAAIREGNLQIFGTDGTLQTIHDRCLQRRETLLSSRGRQAIVEAAGWKAFLFRYDREKAAKDLNQALDYWLGQREAQPEKRNRRKCVACGMNAAGLCQYALSAPDASFGVEKTSDGRVSVSRRSMEMILEQ